VAFEFLEWLVITDSVTDMDSVLKWFDRMSHSTKFGSQNDILKLFKEHGYGGAGKCAIERWFCEKSTISCQAESHKTH